MRETIPATLRFLGVVAMGRLIEAPTKLSSGKIA
jgi:hypothetical protein